jgi:hypothetical protein
MHKYRPNWETSLEADRRAAEIASEDEASWWSLGIAATALGRSDVARRAWQKCGFPIPPGEGPMESLRHDELPVAVDVGFGLADDARKAVVSICLNWAKSAADQAVRWRGDLGGAREDDAGPTGLQPHVAGVGW